MTAHQLIEYLAMTGTGSGKLEAARRWLARGGVNAAGNLLAAMEADKHWPAATCEKARALIGGASPTEERFVGSPPKQSKEASEEKMSRMIDEKIDRVKDIFFSEHEERQAVAQARGIGNPLKPEGSEKAKK